MPFFGRNNKTPLGIYIHVPFCRSKCQYCDFYSLTSKKDCDFDGYLSVFCMGADATGVSIRNLHYNVENTILTAGFPLGVSNHFEGAAVEITAHRGTVILICDRCNPFPNPLNIQKEESP